MARKVVEGKHNLGKFEPKGAGVKADAYAPDKPLPHNDPKGRGKAGTTEGGN